MIQYPLIFL